MQVKFQTKELARAAPRAVEERGDGIHVVLDAVGPVEDDGAVPDEVLVEGTVVRRVELPFYDPKGVRARG